MPSKLITKKLDQHFNLLSALFAFLVWGGWAFYVNDDSISTRIISGLGQGIISCTLTLLLIKMVTKTYYLLPKERRYLLLPAFIMFIFIGIISSSIHYLINTPNIIQTIAPSVLMSFGFCVMVTLKIRR